ncbi:hypothetical protein Tco_0603498 [Tanacetum coccineum]
MTIPSRITSSPLELSFVANTHVTTPPVRRPGRPPLQPNVVQPRRNVRPRLTRNDDHMNMSTHPTPHVMLSSVTVVDTDGNPVHHTQLPTETNPSCPTTNVVHSLYNSTSTRDMSTSTTIQQNDTNVPMSVHRMARQNRRIREYCDSGDATYTCSHCQAKYWYGERTVRRSSKSNPKFSTCCSEGKVQLPFLHDAPQLLQQLMDYNGGELSKLFRKKIKVFNAMLFPTPIPPPFHVNQEKINREINDGHGPYTFRLNGHNHHRIGTLLPTHADGRPRFAQLYIYDTENEVDNRIHALNLTNPDNNIRFLVQYLIAMLNLNNLLVQSFRMARERFNESSMQPVTLRLLSTRQRNAREYNLPIASEVVALVPGDGNPTECRDVIVEERRTDDGHNPVKCISELHPSFMALQYPLLFPYGEDGFQLEKPLNVPPTTKRKYTSLREYYCFRLQCRTEEGKTLHKAGRLFHTYA